MLLLMISSRRLQKRISLHDPGSAQSNQRKDCVSNLSFAEHLKETKCKFLHFECSPEKTVIYDYIFNAI